LVDKLNVAFWASSKVAVCIMSTKTSCDIT